jgi:dTDP-4-amino-4,6-dideoxygalactose transaminase
MNINFLDLKKNYLSIKPEIDAEYNNLFENCDFIHGNKVKIFEKNFADYIGIKHIIGCANGTDALEIAIKSFDLSNDDEVIVQGNTYIASCLGVLNNNIKLVLCDIDPNTHMIDINHLESLITSKTKAIIVVHLFGLMPDMDKITTLCKNKNLFLIEDCAQAHGAKWGDKKAGTFGDICCFSFYPGKNLGAYGDGGAVGTNSDELNEKIRKMANLGCKIKYHHELIGRNSRLDTLQAGFLNVKLKYLEDWNSMRRENANEYNLHLCDIEQITLPKVNDNCLPVFHLYVIKTDYRDELKDYLAKNNITCLIHYPICIPETEAMIPYSFTGLDNCIDNSKKILSLPMYPELTKQEIHYVCKTIRDFFFKKNLISLKNIKTLDKPGVLHFLNNVNFDVKRLFYIDYCDTGDSSGFINKRGLHANINFDEMMVVIYGEVKLLLTDVHGNTTERIYKKDEIAILPRMYWIEFSTSDKDTTILFFANEILSKSISIHDYDQFINYNQA